jgi:hypothetical protein
VEIQNDRTKKIDKAFRAATDPGAAVFVFRDPSNKPLERFEQSAAVEPFDELRAGYWNGLDIG